MSKEVGKAIQKAYNDSRDIILESKNAKDCKKKLEDWLGVRHSVIDDIVKDYDKIKKNLTNQRNK